MDDDKPPRKSDWLPGSDQEFLPEPELPTFSESGVDLTLIRWMLSLTYKQRLDALQNHVNFAGKVKRVPNNSPIRADISDPAETSR